MKKNTHTCNDCGAVWSSHHLCPAFKKQRRIILGIWIAIWSAIGLAGKATKDHNVTFDPGNPWNGR